MTSPGLMSFAELVFISDVVIRRCISSVPTSLSRTGSDCERIKCEPCTQRTDALSHCESNSYSKGEVNVISITKGFVQWVQQLLAPLWDCMCGALLVPLKLEECHQMVKSRSEYVVFHPAFFFLMVHYSVLHLLLPIMENTD